jgi:four helix bundle protein
MARDHRQLRVFHQAHELAIAVYRETRAFPRDEWFGIRAQLRRSAVSIPSNLVEGSARRGVREYCNFLNVARGSAAEVSYLIGLAGELGFLPATARRDLGEKCARLIPQLESLVQTVDALRSSSRENRGSKPPKPSA